MIIKQMLEIRSLTILLVLAVMATTGPAQRSDWGQALRKDTPADEIAERFSLARGARSFPIDPGDPRLAPNRKVQLPRALQPRRGRNGQKAPIIMLAVSGGGSRAAYYAACVMEQLSRIELQTPHGKSSVLDEVAVMSSVSGGGLAAAWYVVHHHERRTPGFFQRFRKAMAVNLQWSTYGGVLLFPPLALQMAGPTVNRTDLLAKEIENLMGFGPVTFAAIEQRENDPVDPSPVLIVNGTVYNSGQRFVMSNLPTEFLPSIYSDQAHPVTNKSVEAGFLRKLLEPVTMEQVGMDVRRLRLATALAASAAFPVLLAPVRLQVHPESIPPALCNRGLPELMQSDYLHIADGGLHDNFGTDSLLSVAKALPKDQPVLLVIIDATVRSETLRLGRSKTWYPWTSVMRMYDIGSLRGLGMAGAMVNDVRPLGNHGTVLIKMAATDPVRQSILNKIPTSFSISHGNRRDLEATARENVRAVAASIQSEYARLLAGRHFKTRRINTTIPSR
jgi:predicted acylesterase/phospholipase RssA